MLVCYRMNTVHRLACAGLRDHSMAKWIIASWNVGSTSHQERTMAAAMQATLKEEMATLVNILQQETMRGSGPVLHVEGKAISKENVLRRLKSAFQLWPNLVCHVSHVPGAKKDFIGPRIVGPSSISRGSL